MKNTRFYLICLCFIYLLTLTSCVKRSNDEILTDAKDFLNNQKNTDLSLQEHFGYQEGLGSWLDLETDYKYDENSDNSDGIISLSGGGYTHIQDRLYFQISKQTQLSTGDNFWAYVSTKTGEKHYICPDPLCGHDEESGCPYINLQQMTFHPYNDSLVYAVKQDFSNNFISRIYEIDLKQNTFYEIYNAKNTDREAKADYIYIYFILDNYLYFRDRFVHEEIIDGEKILTEKTYLARVDLESKKTEILNNDFSSIGGIHIIGTNAFYTDIANRTLYCKDINSENPVSVMTYDEGYQIYKIYYDNNTEELYLLVSRADLHHSAKLAADLEASKCRLYCITKDLACREILMPSSLLLDVQLTNEYIYYLTYDPINYKKPPYTRDAIDIAGNKIYRVKRSDTSKGELVFDGHSEIFFRDFFAAGDYVYMDYYSLVIREEGQVFRRMGSTVRVNIKENTLKWMNLD